MLACRRLMVYTVYISYKTVSGLSAGRTAEIGGDILSTESKDFRFDKRASKYDGFEGKLSRKFYRLLLREVALFPGAKMLDVGCGTGALLRSLVECCAVDAYGIDVEQAMVTEAQKKCPEMDIRLCGCADTPFEAQTFDVVIACMAYHHFPDQKGFAREAARILKPGGCLYIADPRFPSGIRKAINGLAQRLRVAGHFETPRETSQAFRGHGFSFEGFVFDAYAQMVKLRLTE